MTKTDAIKRYNELASDLNTSYGHVSMMRTDLMMANEREDAEAIREIVSAMHSHNCKIEAKLNEMFDLESTILA